MSSLASAQQLTDAVNSNMQTFQSFAEISLNATERLTSLNMNAARSMFAYASAGFAPLSGEGMREQLASRMSAQGQGLEQVAEYVRNVNEVLLKAQADASQLSARRMGELTDSLHAMLDNLAKTGPAGSADVVAAMKSALNTASATFENMIATAREVAETNLSAAASALHTTASEAAALGAKSTKKAA